MQVLAYFCIKLKHCIAKILVNLKTLQVKEFSHETIKQTTRAKTR